MQWSTVCWETIGVIYRQTLLQPLANAEEKTTGQQRKNTLLALLNHKNYYILSYNKQYRTNFSPEQVIVKIQLEDAYSCFRKYMAS